MLLSEQGAGGGDESPSGAPPAMNAFRSRANGIIATRRFQITTERGGKLKREFVRHNSKLEQGGSAEDPSKPLL